MEGESESSGDQLNIEIRDVKKKAKERISKLVKELKKKEIDEKEKYITLKREIRCLERGKMRQEYEIESWKKRFRKLQTQELSLRQHGEVEKELEVCKKKCNELGVELEEKKMECVGFEGKFKELMASKISVDHELNVYKRSYNRLREQIMRLEENREVVSESEKKAQDRIAYLSGELEKMNRNDKEKYAELKMEIRDLEGEKRRAQDENDGLRKRFTDLETRFSRLKHELEAEKVEFEACRTKYGEVSVELEKKKRECGAVQDKFEALMLRKIAVDDELKECKTICNGLTEKITRIEKEQYILCGKEKRAQERIAQLLEELKMKERDKLRMHVQFEKENRETECRGKLAEDETEIWKNKCTELETQSALKEKREAELEKELNECRSKCDGLSMKLNKNKMECEGKLEDLLSRKISVDYELKEYKITCNGLKEKISHLEENQKVICEREKRAREEITKLSEDLKNLERDERNKYEQLKKENQDLEIHKKRAETEIDDWKRRFYELETRVLRVEEEGSTLRCKGSDVSGDAELGPEGFQNEVSHDDDGKEDRSKTSKLQGDANRGDDCALMAHVTGAPSIDMQCVPTVNVEEKGNSPIEPKLEFGKDFQKQLVFELEGSSKEMQSVLELGSVRSTSEGGIIEISDDSSDSSPDRERDMTPKKCLKRLYFGQRGDKYGGICDEDSTFASSSKQKRASEIITCDSDSEEDVKMKKLQEVKDEFLKPSPVTMLSETPSASCGGQNVEEAKAWADRTYQLEMSGMSNEMVGDQTADSESDGYSSTDYEDSGRLRLDFDNAMNKLRANADKELKLKVEVDKDAHELHD